MPIRSLVALGLAAPVLRELRYCRWCGGSTPRFAGGPIGRAQERAEKLQWLIACPQDAARLRLTAAGKDAIGRLEAALAPAEAAASRRHWRPASAKSGDAAPG